MSKYRCWICDTEYYEGEEELARQCCSNVKKWILKEETEKEEWQKQFMEIVLVNEKLKEKIEDLEKQLKEWLQANSPNGWIDDLRKDNAKLKENNTRLKFLFEEQLQLNKN